MSRRACAEPGCGRLVPQGRTRCPEHSRVRDKARGTRQARGYDAEYDRVGADYERAIANGQRFRCWVCDVPLGPKRGRDWHLGHDKVDRSIIRGPECPACNLSTARAQQ